MCCEKESEELSQQLAFYTVSAERVPRVLREMSAIKTDEALTVCHKDLSNFQRSEASHTTHS